MRAQADGIHLVLDLVIDPGVDQLLGEHPALEQELVIGFQGVEDFGQAAGGALDPGAACGARVTDRLAQVLVDEREARSCR